MLRILRVWGSSLVWFLVVLSLTVSCRARTPEVATVTTSDKPGTGVTLRPTATSYPEEIFTADIASLGLEELGYSIAKIKELDYSLQLVAIANGEIDFPGIHYEKLQAGFFKGSGGTKKLMRVGKLYNLIQGYLIDKATAEKHNIRTIDQLKDPKLAKIFDTDGDGKANLTGCEPGWSCNKIIDHHIKTYGLTKTVEQDAGNYSILIADVVTRYKQGSPVLYYFYTPYWIHSDLEWGKDVVILPVPYTALPGEQSNVTTAQTTRDGINYGFEFDTGSFVVSNNFARSNPAAVKFLEQVQVPEKDMNALSIRAKKGENKREDIRRIAKEWIESNRKNVDQWLEKARRLKPESSN